MIALFYFLPVLQAPESLDITAFLIRTNHTDIAVTSKKKFDDDFVVEMIQNLEDAKNVDTINGETLFSAPSASLSFRGEGATVKLAEDDGNLLKVFLANKQTAGFNPFD